MWIPDHKPALCMALTSCTVAVANAAVPTIEPSLMVQVTEWVHLIGGIAGALAGFASFAWYGYSFIKAQRAK